MTIAGLLLPEVDGEVAVTRRVLERVPDGHGEWRPHPRSFPIGHLAQLVARLPGWGTMVMQRTGIDIAPPGGGQFAAYSLETTSTLLAEFDRNAAAARDAIAAATDADFAVSWTLVGGGRTLRTGSRYEMLRYLVLNHLVHHRAQLGVYLRLVDVAVPEMYGPSADEGKP